jgi:bifunctional DNase/RNase
MSGAACSCPIHVDERHRHHREEDDERADHDQRRGSSARHGFSFGCRLLDEPPAIPTLLDACGISQSSRLLSRTISAASGPVRVGTDETPPKGTGVEINLVIPLSLVGVRLGVPSNQLIVLLREEAPGQRYLPIFIGHSEAIAIMSALQGMETPRPMTHDLLKNLLEELGARLDRVEITELREATFFAELGLLEGGSHHRLSSRPSDAIALAVRYEEPVPIFADETVLESAGVTLELEVDQDEQEIERFRHFLESLKPEDFES